MCLKEVSVVLVVWTTLLSSVGCAIPPDPEGARTLTYSDLVSGGGAKFSSLGLSGFGPLLFDVARDQLFVGAKDALLRLSLRSLSELQQTEWSASIDKAALCQDKGRPEVVCHNYVRILQSDGRRLFTCGTGAFSPLCSWRQLENVSEVLEWVQGVAKCPYAPEANITSLLTLEGHYYIGTPTDFSGSDYAIYRAAPGGEGLTLRTSQYNSKWLNEPQFVGSFEDDKFVYFVFREAAVEYINCGKRIYSRIARVCKNDSGGQLMLRDNWTTFVKARLNCSLPGDYPFYYDEVQGIEYLPDQRLLYATFTTPSNGIAGSAICVYNISAIDDAFRGPFKHQEHPGSAWESQSATHHTHGHCQPSLSRSQQLADSSRYQLMDGAVQSQGEGGRPLHHTAMERYTHISVAVIHTAHAYRNHLLFVATSDGRVKKISTIPNSDITCVIEIWKPDANDVIKPIKSMQYLKETDSVYIGSDNVVLRIGASRCSSLGGREGCLGAQDPRCGWDLRRDVCTPPPAPPIAPHHWTQLPPSCPHTHTTLDGGWSSWSPWEVCLQKGEDVATSQVTADGQEEDYQDKCFCQSRQCNNPSPRNGGRHCQGVSIRVSNCTVHGGWTAWSGWSSCSASCGVAVKWRRRSCGAPAPQYGGRLCVGPDRQEIYCTQNPPCPAPVEVVVEGGWSEWSQWSNCSAECGGGVRSRKRKCDSPFPPPPPQGAPCQGCETQVDVCNTQPCPTKRTSAWTPWITLHNNNSDMGLMEKRYKFSCKGQTQDNIKMILSKEEERYVHGGFSSSSSSSSSGSGGGVVVEGWGSWSEWGDCSADCGGGYQTASRSCIRVPCEGTSRKQRACNIHSCVDGWGCWSEWSECSSSCGEGRQERRRPCLLPQGCVGDSHQLKHCTGPPCEEMVGWSEWSNWSSCDSQDHQQRTRTCLIVMDGNTATSHHCRGPSQQSRLCLYLDSDDDDDNELHALGAQRPHVVMAGAVSGAVSGGWSPLWVVLGAVLGACGGVALALGGRALWGRHSPTRIPSSPHYITQQNSYVSVPLKEVPKKRQPSFSGIRSSSGGLTLSKTNNLSGDRNTSSVTTPKLYPKAMAGCNDYDTNTIKRNSNTNCRNNIDLEQEKFY